MGAEEEHCHSPTMRRPVPLPASPPRARRRDVTTTSLFRRAPLGSRLLGGSLFWARPAGLPAGMLNLGNTCYLNAVVQTLLSLPTFVADLQQLRDRLQQEQRCAASAAVAAPAQQMGDDVQLPAKGVCAGLLDCLTDQGAVGTGGPDSGGPSAGGTGAPGGSSSSFSRGSAPAVGGRTIPASLRAAIPASVIPASLKAAIEARSAAFVGCFQQDAHEVSSGGGHGP